MLHIARIVVNARVNRAATTYDYAIPDHLAVEPGHLVWVPFGHRRVQGIVWSLAETSEVDASALKSVEALIDPVPALRSHQIQLSEWLAAYYCCSRLDAALLMLPPEARQSGHTEIRMTDQLMLPPLDTVEQRLVEWLRPRGAVDEGRLRAALRAEPGLGAAIGRLEESGVIRREWFVAKPGATPRHELFLRAPVDIDLATLAVRFQASAPKRRVAAAVIELVETARRLDVIGARPDVVAPAVEVQRGANVSAATLREMAATGVFALESREVWRNPMTRRPPAPPPSGRALTEAQRAAATIIGAGIGQGGRFLLHGVTGSGKTEVYLDLIAQAMASQRGAWLLTPEIALEPQVSARVESNFPGRVARIHSGLSAGERYDEWRRLRSGGASVVVGSRSALFAPLADPGLIILDEAHEWTYKQEDPPPRYHAREAAFKLAEFTGAAVVLGSATPDVESYAQTRSGWLKLVELSDRVVETAARSPARLRSLTAPDAPTTAKPAPLPTTEIVDLRVEAAAGHTGAFSRRLADLFQSTIARRRQVILFLNRRGSATFVQCQSCGDVMDCPRCAVSYVYHEDLDALRCHQCNRRAQVPRRCPACWSADIGYFGIGAQRVEAEAQALAPAARIVRWDRDTATGRDAHAKMQREFANGEIDVLVGTQMIAKGLDFPNVTLVGIISADTALHLPDFRASERTFQLIAQVAGRAGRGDAPGQVVIQTYSPDHFAIVAAANHDYRTFFLTEDAFRAQFKYPPYGRLIRLLFQHSNEERCRTATTAEAERLNAEILRLGLPDVEVLGPAPAFRRQIRGLYRWQIVLRGANLGEVVARLELPRDATPTRPGSPRLGWAIDVDPISMM